MEPTLNTLHTARLKNNCPICFGTDGLELTFTQTEKISNFFKIPDSKIAENLYCHTCKNTIYPVNYTDDIERVYEYNKKIAETNKLYLKVKPLFYILIILGIILVAAIIYMLMPV